MGIKRLALKRTSPESSEEELEAVEDAAASSSTAAVDEAAEATTGEAVANGDATIVDALAAEKEPVPAASSAADEQLQIVAVPDAPTSSSDSIAPKLKRMRKKGAFMPGLALESSPGFTDVSSSQLVALDEPGRSNAHGSPRRVGSPGTVSFPTRRRSVASPARRRATADSQSAPLASEGKARVAGAARGNQSRDAASNDSDSSSSSSSSGSSSSSSSSGKPEVTHVHHFKEGQRFPTPAVSDTARDFFVTLFQENPESYIATTWLVEHGVFPQPKHGQLLKRYRIQKELRRKAHAESLAVDPSANQSRKAVFVKNRGSSKIIALHKRPERILKKR